MQLYDDAEEWISWEQLYLSTRVATAGKIGLNRNAAMFSPVAE